MHATRSLGLIHSADEADIRCLDNREETKIVEANDVMLRIFWRHRRLLIILVLVPMVVVIPLRLMQPVKYSATANIEATSTAPSADTQVLSILSQVTAVATSPAGRTEGDQRGKGRPQCPPSCKTRDHGHIAQ